MGGGPNRPPPMLHTTTKGFGTERGKFCVEVVKKASEEEKDIDMLCIYSKYGNLEAYIFYFPGPYNF